MSTILENIGPIYKRISHAAMRAGRDPAAVTLLCVTKEVEADQVLKAMDAGLRNFGESKVQELKQKLEEADFGTVTREARWHMIGHLQKNKVKAAVELFDVIQSVDSVELLELVNRHAGGAGKRQKIFLQVKLAPRDTSKYGIEGREKLKEAVELAHSLENIELLGLMTIPPFSQEPEEARPFFKELKELADEFGLKEVSMGMSADFEQAVEEGATIVRVGTAIFGERPSTIEKKLSSDLELEEEEEEE